jgi:CheY-like chemotaxis protein
MSEMSDTSAKEHKVLVVDDDQDIRDAVADLLRDEGFTVSTAGNGKEALELLRNEKRPCCIVLDLMMPVMDGWAFREAQTHDPQLAVIPVCVISAAPNMTRAPVPAPLFVPKPIDIDQLLAIVERSCCRDRAQVA